MSIARRSDFGRVAILFVVLLFSAAFEHRAAEFQFDWSGTLRIENNDKPDGDEILTRLLVIHTVAMPKPPALGFVHLAQVPRREPCAPCLFSPLPRLRAPPSALSLPTV